MKTRTYALAALTTLALAGCAKGGGIPQVNKTLVETTVMVKDGMTVVLGGLKKENKEQKITSRVCKQRKKKKLAPKVIH